MRQLVVQKGGGEPADQDTSGGVEVGYIWVGDAPLRPVRVLGQPRLVLTLLRAKRQTLAAPRLLGESALDWGAETVCQAHVPGRAGVGRLLFTAALR